MSVVQWWTRWSFYCCGDACVWVIDTHFGGFRYFWSSDQHVIFCGEIFLCQYTVMCVLVCMLIVVNFCLLLLIDPLFSRDSQVTNRHSSSESLWTLFPFLGISHWAKRHGKSLFVHLYHYSKFIVTINPTTSPYCSLFGDSYHDTQTISCVMISCYNFQKRHFIIFSFC